ncbi:MAG: hypothetical protein R2847_12005 [Bacteroidia bacterium]
MSWPLWTTEVFCVCLLLHPKRVSYRYTDDYINKLAEFIDDSIPEKKVLLTVTAPSFSGSGAVNTGFARLTLTDLISVSVPQQMIADYLSSKVRAIFSRLRAFVLQQPNHFCRWGRSITSSFPVQYVLKTQDFDKLPLEAYKVYGRSAEEQSVSGVLMSILNLINLNWM